MLQQHFQIIGTGSYLPKRMVSAKEIDQRIGQKPGWTASHIGVHKRYECCLPETILTMGAQAIQMAMQQADLSWDQLDYIIDCSTSKFRPIPNNACHVQQSLGSVAAGIPCMDVQSTCLGPILALNVANGLFASHPQLRHVLVVASEAAMSGVNWKQPKSAALVGDGAGAMVLARRQSPIPMGFLHQTFSEHLDLCRVEGGGHHLPFYRYSPENHQSYLFDMDGRSVFRVALQRLPAMVQTLMRSHFGEAYRETEIAIIPHQASPRALQLVQHALNIPQDRFHVQVDRLGNMAAASIPVMLDRLRCDRVVNRGDQVMLLGTSAGYSQAAMILQV